MELGEFDEAERVLQRGLELAQDNDDLKSQYFLLLLVSGRLEEAERIVNEQFGDDIESLPERFQRFYHFQVGMIAAIRGDLEAARDALDLAVNPAESQAFDDDHIFILTMISFLNSQVGDAEMAERRLREAERAVQRARINGVDDAGIYYTQTVLFALRGNIEAAVQAFRQAYEKGWRQSWLLKIDGRLAVLRGDPEFVALEQQILEDVSL